MECTVTFSGNASEVFAAIKSFGNEGVQIPTASAPAKAAKQVTAAPAVTTGAPVDNSNAATSAAADTKFSVEQVRAAVVEKNNSGKKPQVKDLLTKFGAASVTALPEEKYSAFMSELSAL